MPRLVSLRLTTTRCGPLYAATAASIAACVPSLDASSETKISSGEYVCASAPAIASPMLASWL